MPSITFIYPDNSTKTFKATEGQTILDVAHSNDIPLEGACEGSLACSTCHVIVDEDYFDLLPEPSEDEEDMLDLAFGLTETSRLGCQIKICEDLDGLTVTLPKGTSNQQG